MHASSRIEGDFKIPVGSSHIRRRISVSYCLSNGSERPVSSGKISPDMSSVYECGWSYLDVKPANDYTATWAVAVNECFGDLASIQKHP
jgi:hypothetical protein